MEVEGEEQEAAEEEEVEDSVLPGLVLFPTQVETKGSDLTCCVSTLHATHHQIVFYIELYSYLLFHCCITECEVEMKDGEEAEEDEAAHHQIVIIQLFIILLLY